MATIKLIMGDGSSLLGLFGQRCSWRSFGYMEVIHGVLILETLF